MQTNESRRALVGAGLGALPGVLTFGAGVVVGGEATLSLGVIGMALALIGGIVGAVTGATIAQGTSNRTMIAGTLLGALPGLVMIPVQTRLAFPVLLVGALLGRQIGANAGHRAR